MKSLEANMKSLEATMKSLEATMKSLEATMRSLRANMRSHGANMRSQEANLRSLGANMRSHEANLRLLGAQWPPGNARFDFDDTSQFHHPVMHMMSSDEICKKVNLSRGAFLYSYKCCSIIRFFAIFLRCIAHSRKSISLMYFLENMLYV